MRSRNFIRPSSFFLLPSSFFLLPSSRPPLSAVKLTNNIRVSERRKGTGFRKLEYEKNEGLEGLLCLVARD